MSSDEEKEAKRKSGLEATSKTPRQRKRRAVEPNTGPGAPHSRLKPKPLDLSKLIKLGTSADEQRIIAVPSSSPYELLFNLDRVATKSPNERTQVAKGDRVIIVVRSPVEFARSQQAPVKPCADAVPSSSPYEALFGLDKALGEKSIQGKCDERVQRVVRAPPVDEKQVITEEQRFVPSSSPHEVLFGLDKALDEKSIQGKGDEQNENDADDFSATASGRRAKRKRSEQDLVAGDKRSALKLVQHSLHAFGGEGEKSTSTRVEDLAGKKRQGKQQSVQKGPTLVDLFNRKKAAPPVDAPTTLARASSPTDAAQNVTKPDAAALPSGPVVMAGSVPQSRHSDIVERVRAAESKEEAKTPTKELIDLADSRELEVARSKVPTFDTLLTSLRSSPEAAGVVAAVSNAVCESSTGRKRQQQATLDAHFLGKAPSTVGLPPKAVVPYSIFGAILGHGRSSKSKATPKPPPAATATIQDAILSPKQSRPPAGREEAPSKLGTLVTAPQLPLAAPDIEAEAVDDQDYVVRLRLHYAGAGRAREDQLVKELRRRVEKMKHAEDLERTKRIGNDAKDVQAAIERDGDVDMLDDASSDVASEQSSDGEELDAEDFDFEELDELSDGPMGGDRAELDVEGFETDFEKLDELSDDPTGGNRAIAKTSDASKSYDRTKAAPVIRQLAKFDATANAARATGKKLRALNNAEQAEQIVLDDLYHRLANLSEAAIDFAAKKGWMVLQRIAAHQSKKFVMDGERLRKRGDWTGTSWLDIWTRDFAAASDGSPAGSGFASLTPSLEGKVEGKVKGMVEGFPRIVAGCHFPLQPISVVVALM